MSAEGGLLTGRLGKDYPNAPGPVILAAVEQAVQVVDESLRGEPMDDRLRLSVIEALSRQILDDVPVPHQRAGSDGS